jgi:hypothetical protein
VIADTLRVLVSAMDIIGYTAADRRAERFTVLSDVDIDVLGGAQREIDTTSADILDWVSLVARDEGRQMLDTLGGGGLRFLCDQADFLAWTVHGILSYPTVNQPDVYQDVQVQRFLRDLARQLSALADLAI